MDSLQMKIARSETYLGRSRVCSECGSWISSVSSWYVVRNEDAWVLPTHMLNQKPWEWDLAVFDFIPLQGLLMVFVFIPLQGLLMQAQVCSEE